MVFLLQEIQERAREEALTILGDEPVDVLPTVRETKQMTYINQVIKEVDRRISCSYIYVIILLTDIMLRLYESTDLCLFLFLALLKKTLIYYEPLFLKAQLLMLAYLVCITVKRSGRILKNSILTDLQKTEAIKVIGFLLVMAEGNVLE